MLVPYLEVGFRILSGQIGKNNEKKHPGYLRNWLNIDTFACKIEVLAPNRMLSVCLTNTVYLYLLRASPTECNIGCVV
jgi:hypothetical protein